MKILTDGVPILLGNWQIVFAIFLLISVSQFTAYTILKRIIAEPLSWAESFSLAAAGWLLPASLISLLWYSISILQVSPFIIFAIIVISIILVLFQGLKKISIPFLQSTFWILPGLLGMSILLRLAYVSKAITPLYFDSAQHYLYIKNIMEGVAYPTLPATNYYHLGFHILSAFAGTSLHMDIKNTMLIVGQIILAVIPISIFFMIKRATGSNNAGIFAVLLAGFGWYMPAHAVDWGKYPALTSLPLIQFVLSIAYLSAQQKNTLSTRNQQWLNAMVALGVLTSILFHSRSLIIFGIAFLAWKIVSWRQKLPRMIQSILILVPVIGIILEIIFIQRQDILKPLLDPYINNGLLITSTVFVLLPFAIKFYPNLAFTCILSIFMSILSIFIPIMGLPGYGELTLLDRPFVEMILYLPLSLLGGLGLAGLFQYLQQNMHMPLEKFAGSLLIGLVIINTTIHYDFYPSDCCKIVGPDDLTAIDWMDKNIPADARILISTTELILLPSASSQGSVGADAGIWIPPLINRQTLSMPYNSDLGRRETLDILCQSEINYIYVGEIGQTFDDAQIRANPAWYKALLSMPKAGVYQVIGCN